MIVPVFMENMGRFGHSRQRWVIVGCLMPVCTFVVPQCGQWGPSGHHSLRNHASAAASSGNMRASCRRVIPSRWLLPGALCAMIPSPLLL